MKLKYILTLVAGALVLFSSCKREDPIFGGDGAVQLNPSISIFDKDGGSAVVDVKADAAWKATSKADWITVDPASGTGNAKVTVNVAKNPAEKDRQAIVVFTSANGKMNLTVKQEAGGIKYGTQENPYPASKAYEFAAGLDADAKSDDVWITGIIAKIDEKFGTTFGNATFYITDDGKTTDKMFQVYRALYLGNKKYDNEADQNISVGDKVVICGKCTNYKGNTPETVQNEAYVVSIEEGTSPVLSAQETTKAVAAAETSASFEIEAKNLNGGWTVTTDAAWITSYTQSGTESDTKIDVSFDANTGAERTATFTVSAAGAEDLVLTLIQAEYQENGTAEHPYTIAEALEVIDGLEDGATTVAEVYVQGIISSISSVDTGDYGNATYNLSDNGLDENTVTVFRGYYLEGAKFTAEDQIAVGDIVVVKGKLQRYVKDGNMTPEVAAKNSIVTLNRPLSVAQALAIIDGMSDGETAEEDVYLTGIVTGENGIDVGYGNATFLLTDDGAASSPAITVFRAKDFGNEKFTSADAFKGGDILILTGKLQRYVKDGNMTPELSKGWLVSVKPGEAPGPGPEDNFDYTPSAAYNAAGNLWKPVDEANAARYFLYLNPDWTGAIYDNVSTTECPYGGLNQSTYKFTFDKATTGRWQNQLFFHPNEGHFIPLSADKTYKFAMTVQSDASFDAFFKLEQYNPDGAPKYEGPVIWEPSGDSAPSNIFFEAGKPISYEYEFTGVECSNVNLVFCFGGNPAGATVYVKDIILTEVGGESGEEAVELTEFLSLTDYNVYNVPMVGMELGTPGFYYQAPDWQTTYTATYPVDGNFLKLEVYSADGKVAPGTYVPSAVNGTVNPGEFNLGAESWGGAGGTVWYTAAGGAATFDLVTDGTVEIALDGDVYTIEVKTTAVSAKYVGKLSK